MNEDDVQPAMGIAPTWWRGDERVEPFMIKIGEELDKHNLRGSVETDIYNKVYETIYKVITKYDQKKENE